MLIICFSCISQISAEDADNITLTTDNIIQDDISDEALQQSNSDEILTDGEKSFDDIQNLIDSAQSGSTVTLSGTYKGTGTPISISKNIVLEGVGNTYLNGDAKSTILNVESSQITLKNLIFINGHTDGDGGAIYNDGATVNVDSCKFFYNHADDDGGAIYNYYGTLTILNSDFKENEAGDDGGAIYNDYGTVTVTNSRFESNSAGYWGGALYKCDAYDSQFARNSAGVDGGGMYYGNEFDCTFTGHSPNAVYGTNCYESIYGKITLSQAGSYFGGKTVSAKVIDTKHNTALSGVAVTFKFSNGKSAVVYTNSNGVATYNVPFNPGTYSVTATIDSGYSASAVQMGNIKIAKASAKITPTKLKTKYGSYKSFKVKVINTQTKKGIAGVKLLLKVYTGKKAKKVRVTTDSNGVAYYSAAKLKVGKHKVKVSLTSSKSVKAKAKTSKITVKKGSLGLNTYDALYYYKDVKKGKYYIGVYNKVSGDYLKGIKLKVKVFTGKKSKTYTVKTKKDGFAILKTKGIKVGKHKVQITFKGNKNFKKATAKNTLEVSKKMPTRVGYYYMFTTYSYGGYGSRSVKVFLKDMYGKDLDNKKITITGNYGDKTTGYSGDMIKLPSGSTVVIKFAGDKKYMPSTYTINFV